MKTLILILSLLLFPLNEAADNNYNTEFEFVSLGCPLYLVKSTPKWKIVMLSEGVTVKINNYSPIEIRIILLKHVNGGKDSISEAGTIEEYSSAFITRTKEAGYLAFSSDEDISLLTECIYQ